jgi:uncharacterized membrane protein
MRPTAFAAVLLLATCSVVSAEQRAKTRVLVRDLGLFDGRFTFATAVNDRGHVVGIARDASTGEVTGFLWTPQKGYQTIAANVRPLDINERGQVVGEKCVFGEDCPFPPSGFLWSASEGLRDLGSFAPRAINNKGDMAGQCPFEEFFIKPCVMINGLVTFVPVGANGDATGINARGDVVGTTFVQLDPDFDGDAWSFILSRHGQLTLLPPDPDDPQVGQETRAYDINNRGMVVGSRLVFAGRGLQAAVWTVDGQLVKALRGPSIGRALNNAGAVVGVVLDEDLNERAFLWRRKRDALQLPGIGGAFTSAEDINDRGQVVGVATTATGEPHAVIWRVRP